MSRKRFSAQRRNAAAILAAFVVSAIGCDGSPIEPDPPARLAPRVQIVFPTDNSRANENERTDAPVRLAGRVTVPTGASYTADDLQIVWWYEKEPGFFEPFAEGLEPERVFKVGSSRVQLTAVVREDPALTGADTARFTIRPDGGRISVSAPGFGIVVEQGGKIPCDATFTKDPPRPTVWRVEWLVGEAPVECQSAALVNPPNGGIPTPPLTASLAPGEHEVTVRATCLNCSTPAVVEEQVKVTVKKGIPWVVFTDNYNSLRDRDFYMAQLGRPETTIRLTYSGGEKTWPTISPDGRRLAYTAREGGWCFEVFVANLDLTNPTRLSSGPGEICASGGTRSPVFTPDGSKIAYKGDRPDGGLAPYIVGVDGSGRRQIDVDGCPEDQSVCYGTGLSVAMHPDGRVVAKLDLPNTRDEVVLIDPVTGATESLYKSLENEGPIISGASPDGKWITITSFHTGRILLVDATGGGDHRYIAPGHEEADFKDPRWPFFCGDSEWVYYVPAVKGTSLRRVRIDGTGDEEVMETPSSLGRIVFETPRCVPTPPAL